MTTTVSVNGRHVNSMSADGQSGGAQVHAGVPSGIAQKPSDPGWEASVRLRQTPKPPRLDVEFRGPRQEPGTITRVTARPPTNDEADWSMAALRLSENAASSAHGVAVDPRVQAD